MLVTQRITVESEDERNTSRGNPHIAQDTSCIRIGLLGFCDRCLESGFSVSAPIVKRMTPRRVYD